jgi:hypothetical protein
MAIKGLAYLKTAWAFEERPVASSKLNSWDDRVEAALELAFFLLSAAWGGGNGVVRGATADDLQVLARAVPGLTVEVRPGYAFINRHAYKLAATRETIDIPVPAAQPRIDLVQASLASWDIAVKHGAESATPAAPTPDVDCIRLAHLHARPGMASIKNTDDGSNGYIVDLRNFL